ncbi:MAG: PKD domain-containing protein, partial [Bacteroidales bacterium]|nr:PKD domain-containing protein [Bacteroidales bacterium]
MKKTILLFLSLLGLLLSSEKQFAQTTVWSLDFETVGGYTTSEPEFTDGYYDFFLRTDGSDIGPDVVYNGIIGTYYFAGMDIDGEGATLPVYLDIDDINISGQTSLQFRVYLAEDEANDGLEDWDDSDYVHFYYDVDNSGTFTNLLWIENDGSQYNSAPFIDTNFDGTGDGTEISDTFVQFSVPLPVTGSLIDIQIEFNLNSGDEDIAIDQLEIVVGGGPLPLDANFTADQTAVITGTTVNFTDMTTGGTTPYSYEWDLDGDGSFDDAFIANPSYTYNTPGTYDVSLRVTDDDTNVDTETKTGYITVITPIEVANLATLRIGIPGEVYKVTGEVVLTFQQSFRNQKYIEDATAAILIDDDLGVITTTYNLNDGITGIIGTLGEYGNMTQFVPYTDPGAASSTGNIITPLIITIDDLNDSFDDYEAELVKLLDVTFTDAGATFENGIVYPISDPSKALGNFRTTFYDVDYIGTTIPATADIVVLPNARTDGNYVTCRSLADFEIISNPPTQLAVVSVNGGADPFVSTDFNVIIQAQDALGDPAIVATDINFTFTTNGGDLGTVQFVGGTTTTGTILEGTSQVTVTGVQMAPAGTNVTITATDDNIFG